ncbi:MAG: DUF2828 family protein [Clostridiales bacterium]
MSNIFLKFLENENNLTLTENNAVALKTTNSSLLDLFSSVGSLRTRNNNEIEAFFSKAFSEDNLLTLKTAFYSRNIRGGLGERNTFRVALKYFATLYPKIVIKNFDNIALFGRYDDFYTLVNTPVEDDMWCFIKSKLNTDMSNYKNNKSVSLLAKWLKSINSSSIETNRLGKLTAKKLGFSEKTYRQTLAKLRKYIDVLEIKMSDNRWEKIHYEKVPSRAMSIYRNAFMKHDKKGFSTYIELLQKGETKINAAAIFPYDIIEKMVLVCNYSNNFSFRNYDPLLEAQWKALPNYVEGNENILIMADTSGSMSGRPMNSSIGLAIYFAERNKGAFKNVFMTFSSKPSLIKLKGKTLYDKVKCIPSIVADTNLEKAFKLILKVAVNNKLSKNELPKALVIITDMEFNNATTCNGKWTFYNSIAKNFASYGYNIPNIIFWNVNSRNNVFQVSSKYKGVQLASGQSPSVFKSITANIGQTPYDAMLNVLNDPIYDSITI